MGWLNPKPPTNPTPETPTSSTKGPAPRRSGGWRDKPRKTGGSVTTSITVGDGQSVSVVTAGGMRDAGASRGKGRATASSNVTAGKNSRVTNRKSDGDVKNVRS